MEMTLDQEKFEGAKELSAISISIAKGRALMSQLQEEKETFFLERDAELRDRIELILEESADQIRAIGKNHEELTAYRNELASYAEFLREFYEKTIAFRTASDEYFSAKKKHLDDILAVIRAERESSRLEKLRLDGMREQDDLLRKKLADDIRKVRDDEGRLARAWNELSTKK